MNLPALNPDGYVTASISNVTGFHNINFLFAHGSADDNVHYANSAHLLDMLTTEKVRDFRFRMFTDRYERSGTHFALASTSHHLPSTRSAIIQSTVEEQIEKYTNTSQHFW